jgi:DNA-binding NarL/FixJ family response regulator
MPRCRTASKAIRRLRDVAAPGPRWIALTNVRGIDRSVLDALRPARRGFLAPSDAGAGDIERALHAVLAGGPLLDPGRAAPTFV